MTKIYNLIHLNNHVYMVDKETPKHWYIDDTNFVRPVVTNDPDYWKRRKDYHNVVASDDPSLNLPLLPQIEEDIQALADKRFFGTADREIGMIKAAYILGYKTAKAKKYTEEDMRKAILMAMTIGQSHPEGGNRTADVQKIYNCLNPLPKQVEVEMELDINQDFEVFIPSYRNNYIQVKRWIYE